METVKDGCLGEDRFGGYCGGDPGDGKQGAKNGQNQKFV